MRAEHKSFPTNRTISLAFFGVVTFKKRLYCHWKTHTRFYKYRWFPGLFSIFSFFSFDVFFPIHNVVPCLCPFDGMCFEPLDGSGDYRLYGNDHYNIYVLYNNPCIRRRSYRNSHKNILSAFIIIAIGKYHKFNSFSSPPFFFEILCKPWLIKLLTALDSMRIVFSVKNILKRRPDEKKGSWPRTGFEKSMGVLRSSSIVFYEMVSLKV